LPDHELTILGRIEAGQAAAGRVRGIDGDPACLRPFSRHVQNAFTHGGLAWWHRAPSRYPV